MDTRRAEKKLDAILLPVENLTNGKRIKLTVVVETTPA